jgi:hypothetical protein
MGNVASCGAPEDKSELSKSSERKSGLASEVEMEVEVVVDPRLNIRPF